MAFKFLHPFDTLHGSSLVSNGAQVIANLCWFLSDQAQRPASTGACGWVFVSASTGGPGGQVVVPADLATLTTILETVGTLPYVAIRHAGTSPTQTLLFIRKSTTDRSQWTIQYLKSGVLDTGTETTPPTYTPGTNLLMCDGQLFLADGSSFYMAAVGQDTDPQGFYCHCYASLVANYSHTLIHLDPVTETCSVDTGDKYVVKASFADTGDLTGGNVFRRQVAGDSDPGGHNGKCWFNSANGCVGRGRPYGWNGDWGVWGGDLTIIHMYFPNKYVAIPVPWIAYRGRWVGIQ